MQYAINRDALWFIGKFYAKHQGANSTKTLSPLAFKALFETDMECMETLWLIEVMYAIKRDLLGFNGSWEDYMLEIKGLSQEIRKT